MNTTGKDSVVDKPEAGISSEDQASVQSLTTPPARGPPSAQSDFPIVAIGASAGGLEAVSTLLDSMPADTGMAFILIQHLDPSHPSMMVELLSKHTKMQVIEAHDGMAIAPDHLYVIPPGYYLAIDTETLHLSLPPARHGARLPIDFLLHSLSEQVGPRAACLILSGTGTDGSLGLSALKASGGLVIAQRPDEAQSAGMPQSAITTGLVDAALPLNKMPRALVDFFEICPSISDKSTPNIKSENVAILSEIIALLRTNTAHDFRPYKSGTLERRIERRMGLVGISADNVTAYLERLRVDVRECEQLAKDLLIHVTSFFRDPAVFAHLSHSVIPQLIADDAERTVLRIWVAGCSTGEEAYSIAMICQEAITASGREVKLEVFASDVDPDAVATAREGIYPTSIEADVSADRLARFFGREGSFWRVAPALRSVVVFTVQDMLVDPPFSRIDLVSCRNVLIYLNPEAQAKVIALFHFALRGGGLLLLGSSETAGDVGGRFEILSKTERLYRHIPHSRTGNFALSLNIGGAVPVSLPGSKERRQSGEPSLAELCRRAVLENFAPAAVLIDRKRDVRYSLGPIDRYLRVATGYPSLDLLTMATPALRTKLRLGIEKACAAEPKVSLPVSRLMRDGAAMRFAIEIRYLVNDDEELWLVCFVDQPMGKGATGVGNAHDDGNGRIAELERELEATHTDLQKAIQNQEASNQEHKAINEEALSVNEEFQSTNEELLTSKEELQSLNEELTTLNSQLQETLDRQRTTSDDLQNVLFSTNVATLFLDRELRIRFFTPATKALFNILPGDVGRSLGDLRSLADNADLLGDAAVVLARETLVEREILAPGGVWFMCRIFPYLTHKNAVEGVVITFADITERKSVAKALDEARQKADMANVAKSRFLAAASHDLRQPLQSLTLLQALLAQTVEGEKAQRLVGRFDQTLGAMTGMLNALLDINQIEAGVVKARPTDFPVNDVFDRLRNELVYPAQAKNIALRIIPSSMIAHSDPVLLEQMLRNLLANAIKYTRRGKIVFGARRRGDAINMEVWDSGIGIAAGELKLIFDEFHQLDNPTRDRTRGLGLGLSIVSRLGALLDHDVEVRSIPDKGSVFSVRIPRRSNTPPDVQHSAAQGHQLEAVRNRGCEIIVVDDDPDVLDLLEQLLRAEGHIVRTAKDGPTALALLAAGAIRPEIILTDFNLPNDMNGIQVLEKMRDFLGNRLPGIILTGDISTATLSDIALQDCIQLSKPIRPSELDAAVARLMPDRDAVSAILQPVSSSISASIAYVVDDDAEIRASIRDVLEADGRVVFDFDSAEEFMAAYQPGGESCLLVDVNLPGMGGTDLLEHLRQQGNGLPTIVITGSGDIGVAVAAMKAGACDFIEKPVSRDGLLASIGRALDQSRGASIASEAGEAAARNIAALTKRQREVMDCVLMGHPSKNIAADLGISQRTVENHRAAIMRKMGAKSLPELARLAMAAQQERTISA